MKMLHFIIENPNSKTYYETALVGYTRKRPETFDLIEHLSLFDSKLINELFVNNTPSFFKILIFNINGSFFVLFWCSDVSFDAMSRELSKKHSELRLPHSNYNKIYQNSLIGDNWCIPFTYEGGRIKTPLNSNTLNSINKRKGVQKIFNLNDIQWTFLLNGGL